MCSSHQPGSVTRFHMAIVALMVLLLFLTAAITGTCSLSSEGNMIRHTAPVPSHTISQAAMPQCMPGCPMHQAPCSPSSDHHHGSAAVCAHCTASDPAIVVAATPLTDAPTLAAVSFPGLQTPVPPATPSSSVAPPPLDLPRSARPASLRV